MQSHLVREYGELKLRLKEEFEFDRDAYTAAKSEFIREVTKRARLEFAGRFAPGKKLW